MLVKQRCVWVVEMLRDEWETIAASPNEARAEQAMWLACNCTRNDRATTCPHDGFRIRRYVPEEKEG